MIIVSTILLLPPLFEYFSPKGRAQDFARGDYSKECKKGEGGPSKFQIKGGVNIQPLTPHFMSPQTHTKPLFFIPPRPPPQPTKKYPQKKS